MRKRWHFLSTRGGLKVGTLNTEVKIGCWSMRVVLRLHIFKESVILSARAIETLGLRPPSSWSSFAGNLHALLSPPLGGVHREAR